MVLFGGTSGFDGAVPLVRADSKPLPARPGEKFPSWMGPKGDVFIHRDKFPKPYERPPHPRLAAMHHTLGSKIRLFPWRFYWETSPSVRYAGYFAPVLLYFWTKYVLLPLYSEPVVKKWNEMHHKDELMEKRIAGFQQRLADHASAKWTHGEFEYIPEAHGHH